MVMRRGASWRAASNRARLKEPRRRLPANPTTRRTSFNACSTMPASSTQERESLCAFHARLEVFAYRQHLPTRQRLHDVPLETHRSEEHTSELQSPCNLVCRLLLEKKKKIQRTQHLSLHVCRS